MTIDLPHDLSALLDAHAESLDQQATHAPLVLPALAHADLMRIGVPEVAGGAGGRLSDAVEAIAQVAEHSLSAAFAFWGQRVFIAYLLHGDNAGLRERWLPELLAGRQAGSTGLSNAMKFLSGLETLQIRATPAGADALTLDGRVPWATNVRPDGFLVAVAVAAPDGRPPSVVAVPSTRAGVTRSADLDLIALRGTWTAAVALDAVPVDDADVITADAPAWLPTVRPTFLGLQCAMTLGVARASLAAARRLGAPARAVLGPPIDTTEAELDAATSSLCAGLDGGRFAQDPVALFELRIRLADIAMRAVQLELQASGGRAYHRDQPLGFARRWREAAFIPIVTPSLAQLQGELLRHAAARRPPVADRQAA